MYDLSCDRLDIIMHADNPAAEKSAPNLSQMPYAYPPSTLAPPAPQPSAKPAFTIGAGLAVALIWLSAAAICIILSWVGYLALTDDRVQASIEPDNLLGTMAIGGLVAFLFIIGVLNYAYSTSVRVIDSVKLSSSSD